MGAWVAVVDAGRAEDIVVVAVAGRRPMVLVLLLVGHQEWKCDVGEGTDCESQQYVPSFWCCCFCCCCCSCR